MEANRLFINPPKKLLPPLKSNPKQGAESRRCAKINESSNKPGHHPKGKARVEEDDDKQIADVPEVPEVITPACKKSLSIAPTASLSFPSPRAGNSAFGSSM